jgi:hypothetical protein
LDCRARGLAAIARDMGAQLGLRLESDAESNLERLREFCGRRRLPIALKDAGETPLEFGGRASLG